MNKIFCSILFPLLTLSCIGKYQSDTQKVLASPATVTNIDFKTDTLRINIPESEINWTATEMRGAKGHTGKISFKDGFFLMRNDKIVGGKFIVDMETIDVTDMPAYEKIARKNLIDHLKSNDFFNVASFPESTFEITNVRESNNDSLKISGNLTIREITKNIEFIAQRKNNLFSTNFTFNRFDWNIAYQGSWADKNLIDKYVYLNINISMD